MKRRPWLFMSLAILAGAAFCAPASAGPKEDFAARGAALFADTGLGTNGKSCSSCHGSGSVWVGKPRFPKFALGAVLTLDQAIQACITNALQGPALPPNDEKLTALAVYIDGLYAPAGH